MIPHTFSPQQISERVLPDHHVIREPAAALMVLKFTLTAHPPDPPSHSVVYRDLATRFVQWINPRDGLIGAIGYSALSRNHGIPRETVNRFFVWGKRHQVIQRMNFRFGSHQSHARYAIIAPAARG